MLGRAIAFLLAASCSLIAPALDAQAAAQPNKYELWNRGLRAAEPDPSRGVEVRDLVLQRDAGELRFDQGRLHLLQPIDGRVIGAVFVGRGRFRMAAPIRI